MMGNKVLNNLSTATTTDELYAFNEFYKVDPMLLPLLITETRRQLIAEVKPQLLEFCQMQFLAKSSFHNRMLNMRGRVDKVLDS